VRAPMNLAAHDQSEPNIAAEGDDRRAAVPPRGTQPVLGQRGGPRS